MSTATPLLRLEVRREARSEDYLLLVVDRVFAGIALLMAAPVIAVAAITVAAQSKRSPFIAHRRAGANGSEFWMLKLRTMWTDRIIKGEFRWVERVSDQPVGPKRASDPRIGGRFAAFCRRHSIDELPQLWQVLTGEMSLVGPRPVTMRELSEHYGSAADEVLRVRPGLTGLWQISGRNRLTYRRRVQLDVRLANTLSFKTYFGLLARTVPVLFSGDGAW